MTSSGLKAYWIAHVDVRDPEAYKAYVAANAAPLSEFGGKFLVRGAPQETVEGTVRSRTVVIEFPNLQAANACYNSAGYQAAIALRAPVSEADVTIVEGWGG